VTQELGPPKFQLEDDLDAAVEAIRLDTLAGPIELARRGAAVVIRLTEKAYYERPLHIWMEVQGLARALLEARPDCMPLTNLASETVRPLPELYGRGKDEGARMRADIRARIDTWVAALDARAARIDALRRSIDGVPVSAHAIDCSTVYVAPSRARVEAGRHYVVGGPEKFVPPNYSFDGDHLKRIPLDEFDGFLTGDEAGLVSADSVRTAIACLRFETILL
jgi:hypothetical protein